MKNDNFKDMKWQNHYFLMRHGKTIHQVEKKDIEYPAFDNPPTSLIEEGRQQVLASAEKLKKDNAKIDLIFSSDYLRTRQTTDIVAKKLEIKDIQFDKRLRDINIGVLHGKHISAYKKFFSDESQRFKITPDNGESWDDVRNRVKEFIEEIDKKYKDKNILIVSHGDPLWFLAGVLSGFQTDEQYLNVRYKKLYPQTGQVIKI